MDGWMKSYIRLKLEDGVRSGAWLKIDIKLGVVNIGTFCYDLIYTKSNET